MSIESAIFAIHRFHGDSLTKSLTGIEQEIRGMGAIAAHALCVNHHIDDDFMASTAEIKNLAGQINVIIHAAGILRSLPSILEPGEKVESVSLGAGNAGRKFDLETDRRVA